MCRAWAKRRSPVEERELDTKTLLTALDLLEEERCLLPNERTLQRLAAQGLQAIQAEKLAFWRQRFNIRVAIEWDENSRFFHAAANGRRRHNAISRLEHNGVTFSSHDAKRDLLHDFYRELLGVASPICWNFDVDGLYGHSSTVLDVSAPFSADEISEALFVMDMHANPGPDGFGPSFYKAFWPLLKPRILALFNNFYNGVLNLDALNKAHLVLLPKSETTTQASGFRPISLQNCPMKLISKAMANRVKAAIPRLIDPDQTGFVQGRSIAENFIYAADILSCCHRRKLPTTVLKLDFKKAFDSVSWDSLDTILRVRGFDERWRSWIQVILNTGKTAVMLNGFPADGLTARGGYTRETRFLRTFS